jgi:hypothetical protein
MLGFWADNGHYDDLIHAMQNYPLLHPYQAAPLGHRPYQAAPLGHRAIT